MGVAQSGSLFPERIWAQSSGECASGFKPSSVARGWLNWTNLGDETGVGLIRA